MWHALDKVRTHGGRTRNGDTRPGPTRAKGDVRPTNLVLACVPAKKVKPGRNHFDAAEFGAHHKPRHVAVQLSACRFTERV